MPELPEVETVRRLLLRELGGKRIVRVHAPPEPIVFGPHPPEAFVTAIEGRVLNDVGRRGKFWFLDFGEAPVVFGHLGMSGWVRVVPAAGDEASARPVLREHGSAPVLDEAGLPRFLKMMWEAEDGTRVAMTDGRRLSRLWLGDSPDADPRLARLGPDAHDALPDAARWMEILRRRAAPIKAVLLDQATIAGIGNWIADEALYQAGIAPMRSAKSLSPEEAERLRAVISAILRAAIDAECEYERFPEHWLFAHRWGGGRGPETIGGEPIRRETVAGRTTAWVPGRQR